MNYKKKMAEIEDAIRDRVASQKATSKTEDVLEKDMEVERLKKAYSMLTGVDGAFSLRLDTQKMINERE